MLDQPFIDESLSAAIPEESLQWALKEFFNSGINTPASMFKRRRDALMTCLPGTLGYALWTYYLANPTLPFPGDPTSLFPPKYLALHDSHHVLLGAKTNESGEIYVTAFESGLMSRQDAKILTLLAQIQVLLEHKGIKLFNAAIAQQAFLVGSKTSIELLDSFDPWEHLSVSLIELRQQMKIEPLSDVWG